VGTALRAFAHPTLYARYSVLSDWSCVMPNPWDIPYSRKMKRGDLSEQTLYLAVGKALTKWEGLEAEIAGLFGVLTIGSEYWYYKPALRAFGAVNSTVSRADMIFHAADAFFAHFSAVTDVYLETLPLQAELKEVMKAYSGWAARRNDLAHGYVTANTTIDYESGGTDLITTYLLCPSHGNSKKWPLDWEPKYQYRADEIDAFSESFEELDKRVNDFATRLDRWRKESLPKLPPQSPQPVPDSP
jgi:hypothetical protein